MRKKIILAQKRICFQGRGTIARVLDRTFFAVLGGLCLYIGCGTWWLSALMSISIYLLLFALAKRRWDSYLKSLWNSMKTQLRQENWMEEEAARIRASGETILYPKPDAEKLTGYCLNAPKGTRFHCFEAESTTLAQIAENYGCVLLFHPRREGETPTDDQIESHIEAKTPTGRKHTIIRILSQTESRYYIAGVVLLGLSMVLRRAVYWRILASLCFFVGTIKRMLHHS